MGSGVPISLLEVGANLGDCTLWASLVLSASAPGPVFFHFTEGRLLALGSVRTLSALRQRLSSGPLWLKTSVTSGSFFPLVGEIAEAEPIQTPPRFLHEPSRCRATPCSPRPPPPQTKFGATYPFLKPESPPTAYHPPRRRRTTPTPRRPAFSSRPRRGHGVRADPGLGGGCPAVGEVEFPKSLLPITRLLMTYTDTNTNTNNDDTANNDDNTNGLLLCSNGTDPIRRENDMSRRSGAKGGIDPTRRKSAPLRTEVGRIPHGD